MLLSLELLATIEECHAENPRQFQVYSLDALMPPLPWYNQIDRRLTRWRRQGRLAGPWIVAVSGGSDSVGLLRILHELGPRLGLELSVAHLDHGSRANSTEDAEFVAELARSLNLPFDLGHWKSSRQAHFEADARRARYAWLIKVARLRGASAIVVGHTRDDQAETILQRILRGTGPSGLAGMAWRRPLAEQISLIRPLLECSHEALQTLLISRNQTWREDPTNLDQARTRSRLRHDLVPKLSAEYNPKVIEALVRLGRLSVAERRGFAALAASIGTRVVCESSDQVICMDLQKLRELSPILRLEIIRRAWRSAHWPEREMTAPRWRRLANLIRRESARISVGVGVEAVIEAGQLRLIRGLALPQDVLAAVNLPIPGHVEWQGGRIEARLIPLRATFSSIATSSLPRREIIDHAKVEFPLVVSSARAGDRFDPLGMHGQTTPLADFLRGRGFAKAERARIPILRDQGGILWVVGQRIAERVRLSDTTHECIELCWIPSCD